MNESGSNKALVAVLLSIVAFLTLCLVLALGFLGHALWRNYWWKQEVYGLSGYYGSTVAVRDFRAGKLRVYVIAGERNDDQFSGTNDGPFEVWHPQYYPSPYPMRYSAEERVKFYNMKMRYMYEHPEKFLSVTNFAEPRLPTGPTRQ